MMELPYSATLTVEKVGRNAAWLQSLPGGGSEREWLELEHVVLEAIAINQLTGTDAQLAAQMAWNAVKIEPAPAPGERTRRELHGMIETLEAVAYDRGYEEGRAAERRSAEATREAEKQKVSLETMLRAEREAYEIEQRNVVQAEEIGLLNRALRSVLGSRLRTTP